VSSSDSSLGASCWVAVGASVAERASVFVTNWRATPAASAMSRWERHGSERASSWIRSIRSSRARFPASMIGPSSASRA
jgi:hypothetical protein